MDSETNKIFIMKTTIFIFVIFFLIGLKANSQTNHFPKGAYMNFDEIVSKKPSKQVDLKIIKRTMKDIKMYGGNDYKLLSADKSVSKKTIKQRIWAYSLGDTLYLNCYQFNVQKWYADLISDGKYLVFEGGLSEYLFEQDKQLRMDKYYGAWGGPGQLATFRFLYVIDKNTQKVITITSKKMQEFLKERNDLLTQFNNESKKDDDQVLIKYLKLLNENH
jgi:hypothetical protein